MRAPSPRESSITRSVNATDEWKCTPLRQAVTRNWGQFVEYLIAQGADVNQDWEGDTVLLEGTDRRALTSVNITYSCKMVQIAASSMLMAGVCFTIWLQRALWIW